MNLVDTYNSVAGPEEPGADIPVAPHEHFVNTVYSSVDEAAVRSDAHRGLTWGRSA